MALHRVAMIGLVCMLYVSSLVTAQDNKPPPDADEGNSVDQVQGIGTEGNSVDQDQDKRAEGNSDDQGQDKGAEGNSDDNGQGSEEKGLADRELIARELVDLQAKRSSRDGCDICSWKVDTLSSRLTDELGAIRGILKSQEKQIAEIYNSMFNPRDCGDISSSGKNATGLYVIGIGGQKRTRNLQVFCDFTTPGGEWLVFQRRKDGSVNFQRNWGAYVSGFGDPSGEFWIGNEVLHLLTSQRKYKLRVDLEDFKGQKVYAEYTIFSVGSAAEYYQLRVGGYSGNAGDSLAYQNSMKFSTVDVDNDADSKRHCAQVSHGAWWYNQCHQSNLNGLYLGGEHKSAADGVNWNTWWGLQYSLKMTEMKIAPLY